METRQFTRLTAELGPADIVTMMEETIHCWLCDRPADKSCATCDRPVCPEHTIAQRVGDRFDFLEVEVCVECAENPPGNPKAA